MACILAFRSFGPKHWNRQENKSVVTLYLQTGVYTFKIESASFQRAECWRSAVDLSGRLLTLHGQGLGKVNIESKITPQNLQVRTDRLMSCISIATYIKAPLITYQMWKYFLTQPSPERIFLSTLDTAYQITSVHQYLILFLARSAWVCDVTSTVDKFRLLHITNMVTTYSGCWWPTVLLPDFEITSKLIEAEEGKAKIFSETLLKDYIGM
jgi:hypothetical protein